MIHRFSSLVGLAVFLAAGSVVAQQAPATPPHGLRKIDRYEQQKALQTWSDENKRRAAEPVEVPVFEMRKPKKSTRHPKRKAAMPSVPGDVRKAPYKWAGKLYFESANGKPHSCSAAYVGPNLVLTAAHCVIDRRTRTSNRNFVFWQAFDVTPKGDTGIPVALQCVQASPDWDPRGNDLEGIRWDYAFAKTAVPQASGSLRFNATTPVGPTGRSIGYPVAIDTGDHLRVASGDIQKAPYWAPRAVAMDIADAKFTEGVSGGPWVTSAPRAGSAQVVSVNSIFIKTSASSVTMLGPAFTAKTRQLRDAVARCRST